MTASDNSPESPGPGSVAPRSPEPKPGAEQSRQPSRAGRDLPAAIASGLVLGAAILTSLFVWKPAFMVIVVAAVLVAVWELGQAFGNRGIRMTREPVMAGGVVMVLVAYLFGAPALATATALTALVSLLWRLRGGVAGYVSDVTASFFTIVYVPFLGAFVALLLAEQRGDLAIVTFVLVTIASDIGGYAVGVVFGRHPMAPLISPKKSWEGFVGSTLTCVAVASVSVVYLLDGQWWIGVVLGVVAAVMATLGDLCESVVKRDLGIKDMSQIVPGHGGLMDRLDSLLATAAPTWMLLHYLVL